MSTQDNNFTASDITAEETSRVSAKLQQEIDEAKASLVEAKRMLKKAQSDYTAAEKAEKSAWKKMDQHPRSANAREEWEAAHKKFDRASSTRFSTYDHCDLVEKRLAVLTDPKTLEERLAKRRSNNAYFGKLRRTGTSTSGTRSKGADMAGKLTAIEAVLKVLKDAGAPMQMPDIIAKAVPLTNLSGANPGQTIYSVVYSEAKKADSRVKQVGRGTFELSSAKSRGGNGGSVSATASGGSRKRSSTSTKKTSTTSRKKTATRSSGTKKTSTRSSGRKKTSSARAR